MEWNTETDREFQEYFPVPEDLLIQVRPVTPRERLWKFLGGLFLLSACAGFWYLFFTHV